MQEELLQFILQKVWTLVHLPNGKRAIGTKWVYRNKKDERGIVIRNKARLVAQGYTQEEIIDYDEEVYVCQPPGFEDPQFPDKVYKVEKALYGLHQAPKAWYETLSTYLIENGFRRGTIDKTLFIKKDKGDILLVQVYVDDIIFGSTKKSLCDEFEVQQKKDGIFISQDKYVVDILKKFDFITVKTASTPMEPNKALVKDEEADSVDVHLYRSMIGSLIYLKGQPKLGLWYPRDSPFDLEAFSDSDYTGASLDRKSTTGGCQFLSKKLISWQCKKQTIVANSTIEAEYVSAANCCGQVIKIHTDHNVADLLTKAFDVSRFNFLVASIGLKLKDKKELAIPGQTTTGKEFSNPLMAGSFPKTISAKLKDLPEPFNDTYDTPSHTKKVFSNMARQSKCFSRKVTLLFDSMLVQNHAPEGEGSAIPPEPQPTPSISQPNVSEPQTAPLQTKTPLTVSHELQTEAYIEQILPSPSTYHRKHRKTQKHRRAKKVTELPQTSVPLDLRANKAIHNEGATAPRNHGGALAQTRSKIVLEKPNEPPLTEGHTSGSKDGSMKHTFELMDTVPPTPHDSPLTGGYTPGSDEGRIKLKELMTMCIKFSKQVLDLEKENDAQVVEILKLKQKVKKLETKRKSSISHPRNRIYRQVESSDNDLDEEDASKQGRTSDKTKPMFKDSDFNDLDDLVDEGMAFVQEKDVQNQGVSIAAPRTPTTTTVFDDEDVTMVMAQTLIKMKEEKAKAKGVAIKDVEDSSRPIRSITTLQPLPTIDPKDKGKGVLVEEEPEKLEKVKRRDQGLAQIESDAELAQRLHEEELAELDRAQKEKQKQEEATNAALAEEFDEIQARMDADHELAPNELPLPEGHTSGSEEGRLEHTFELMDIVPPTPYDSPLPRYYTPGSDEGRLKLKELMAMCTKLSKQVLDLEKEKDAQAVEILKLKQRVKKLERKRKSSISHPRRRIYRQVESSDDDLDEEDASEQGRKSDKTKSMFKDSDFDVLDDDMENVEGETVNTATTGVSVVSAPVTTAGVAISTAEPRTPPTTAATAFIDEDLTIAQTLVKMRSEKAKEKGVAFRDVEETPRLTRSTTTLQPLPTIDPKDKELAQRLHEEELAELDRAQKEKQKQEEATNSCLVKEFDEIQDRMDA
ncbi:putative ribonuclease H-like domain-containing protein [Tanacetum coccineum]|uniref:Ribonuclease H-like domain-containing protein n=1 Tax=Tanacetum coccineum TaxID=301880 RepID=A0ABQ5ABW4_9ASTR